MNKRKKPRGWWLPKKYRWLWKQLMYHHEPRKFDRKDCPICNGTGVDRGNPMEWYIAVPMTCRECKE